MSDVNFFRFRNTFFLFFLSWVHCFLGAEFCNNWIAFLSFFHSEWKNFDWSISYTWLLDTSLLVIIFQIHFSSWNHKAHCRFIFRVAYFLRPNHYHAILCETVVCFFSDKLSWAYMPHFDSAYKNSRNSGTERLNPAVLQRLKIRNGKFGKMRSGFTV